MCRSRADGHGVYVQIVSTCSCYVLDMPSILQQLYLPNTPANWYLAFPPSLPSHPLYTLSLPGGPSVWSGQGQGS